MGHSEVMSEFDAKAAGWDTPERVDRARTMAGVIREHLSLDRDMKLLDLGAGTGLLGLNLLVDVGSVVLADPSAGMVREARVKITAAGITDASAIVFDVPAPPPPGSPFDVVVSSLVLHHVEDTQGVLRSVHEMLRPGGQVGLIDLDAEDGTFHDPDAPGIHHHGFAGVTLTRLAEDVGFSEVGWRLVMELERDGRTYPLFLLTARRP
jgi:ubiquinone/menaquinone biosynthesis C-methylase UbiE